MPSASRSGFWQAVQNSNDTSTITVMFENFAALAGLLVAFLGVYLSHALSNPALDAIASILIGLILATTAMFLAYKSKSLLVGETADASLVKSVREIVEGDPSVEEANSPLTMQLGPNNVLLNLEVRFRRELSGSQLVAAINRLEKGIRERHPDITRIFMEAKSLENSQEA